MTIIINNDNDNNKMTDTTKRRKRNTVGIFPDIVRVEVIFFFHALLFDSANASTEKHREFFSSRTSLFSD